MDPQLRATLIHALFGDDPAALTHLLDQLAPELGPASLDALLEGLFTTTPTTLAVSLAASEGLGGPKLVACA